MERHFEGKLYNSRSAEGMPNWKELKQIRKLDEALSAHEAFVGIAPYGSVVGGYGNKESDIDIKILSDSSLYKNGYNFEELRNITEEVREKMREQDGKEFHIYFHDLAAAVPTLSEVIPPAELGRQVADMYRLVTGDKIRTYREKVAEYIRQFPQDYQDAVRRTIVNVLITYETPSMKKYEKRVPGLTDEDKSKLFRHRLQLVQERVDRMLTNPEETVADTD